VRCLCIGQEDVLPMKYDPAERRYHVEHDHLGVELGRRVVDDSLKLVRALGYDMNSVEWAIRDGVPYAIDFMNPAPDAEITSVGQQNFEWIVDAVAEMAVKKALSGENPVDELRWASFLNGPTPAESRAPRVRKKA
jgi:hypothetical protein